MNPVLRQMNREAEAYIAKTEGRASVYAVGERDIAYRPVAKFDVGAALASAAAGRDLARLWAVEVTHDLIAGESSNMPVEITVVKAEDVRDTASSKDTEKIQDVEYVITKTYPEKGKRYNAAIKVGYKDWEAVYTKKEDNALLKEGDALSAKANHEFIPKRVMIDVGDIAQKMKESRKDSNTEELPKKKISPTPGGKK